MTLATWNVAVLFGGPATTTRPGPPPGVRFGFGLVWVRARQRQREHVMLQETPWFPIFWVPHAAPSPSPSHRADVTVLSLINK
jgi:hypothetical protein